MNRYIIIDNCTGYIFGDTADFLNGAYCDDPIDAVKKLDESIGNDPDTYIYEEVSQLYSNEGGYSVYKLMAPDMIIIRDGQDQAAIDGALKLCNLACHIKRVEIQR